MNRTHLSAGGFVFTCLFSVIASAAITLPPMFGDHMVLQRGIDVPVWGTASQGEKITVDVAGHSAAATADDKGDWACKIPSLKIGEATSMTIKGESGGSGRLQ